MFARSQLRRVLPVALVVLAATARADVATWRRYTRQGTREYRAGALEKAEKSFLRAAKVGHGLDDNRRRYVESLGHLAAIYRAQERPDEVRKAYAMAVRALEKSGEDHPALPGVLVKAAAAELHAGEPAAAAARLERSASLLADRGEGGAEKAQELRTRAASLRLQAGDAAGAWTTFRALAMALQESAGPGAPELVKAREGALAAAEALEDPAKLRTARLELADELGRSERPDDARRQELYATVLANGVDSEDEEVRSAARRAAEGLKALAARSGDLQDQASASLAAGRLDLGDGYLEAAAKACEAVLANPQARPETRREARLCAAEAAIVEKRYQVGLSHLRELRAWRDALPPSDPRRLRPLRLEAQAQLALGRDALSEPTLRALLRVQVEVHGARSLEVADTLEKLGQVRITQGDATEAEELLEKAVALRGVTGDALDRAGPQLLLARLQLAQDKPGEAGETLEALRKELEAADLERHPRYLELLGLVAAQAREAGDTEAAKRAIAAALEARREADAWEDPATIALLHDRGVMAQVAGDLDAARASFDEALGVAAAANMEEHPMAARVEANLGVLKKAAGDRAAARKHYQDALEALGEAGMSRTYLYATVTNNLAVLDAQEGRVPEARTGYRTAQEIFEQTRGPDSEEALDALESRAELAIRTKDWSSARRLYPKLILGLERSRGKEHGVLAEPIYFYASALQRLPKRRRKAKALFRRAHRIARKELGVDHPVTKRAGKMLEMFARVAKRRGR